MQNNAYTPALTKIQENSLLSSVYNWMTLGLFISGFTAYFASHSAGIQQAIYGYFTKTDLTSWGKYLFMGLIGIIIAAVVNFFLRNPMMDWIISFIGIFIFVGLTAYDTQKIRRMGENMASADSEQFGKVAVIGALALYLDFINLFLMFLRFFGRGRD